MAQFFMFLAAGCYLGACVSYLYDNKFWMAVTVLLYAAACGTIWMAGDK